MRHRIDLPGSGSVAGWLAAGMLFCASVSAAYAELSAQNNVQNPAPAASGPAPSADTAAAAQAPKPASVTPQLPAAAPSILTLPLPPQPALPPLGNSASNPSAAPTQTAAPGAAPSPATGQTASLPAAPDDKRGFLNDLGKWWDDSIANFNAKMKEQQAKLDEFNKQQTAAAKDAAQAMKSATDAMFTPSKIIETQERCPVAGNGAPDCATAAANFCKAKGFSDGRPMDVRAAERCKASLWVSGQTPTPADCPMETVLLRVACQP
jgi:hypothetical protein